MAIYGVEGREREYDDTYDLYNPDQPVVTAPPVVAPPATAPPAGGPPTTTTTTNNQSTTYVPGAYRDRNKPPPFPPPEGTTWKYDEANGWYPSQNNIGNTSGTGGAGAAGGVGSGGMGEFSAGSYLPEGWGWPSYSQPTYLDPGAFDPGPAFTYKDFTAPTAQSMVNEPGFQFRLDQGRKALEASAAGKGVLRSGGTLKDILGYGQNFASQEYGNVFNRATQEYDMNRQNAADIWGKQYGQRRDVYGDRAANLGQQNVFNQRNTEFGFTGRQRQAELDLEDAFRRWAKEGDWQTDIFTSGSQ